MTTKYKILNEKRVQKMTEHKILNEKRREIMTKEDTSQCDKDELSAMKERKYMERKEINNIKKLLEEEGEMPASKRMLLGEGHHYNVLKKIIEKSSTTN